MIPRCSDPTELGLSYSQREEMVGSKEDKVDNAILNRNIINMLIILKVDDAILMAEVMAAGEGQLEALVERLRQQGVHSTHYIMIRLGLRLIVMLMVMLMVMVMVMVMVMFMVNCTYFIKAMLSSAASHPHSN